MYNSTVRWRALTLMESGRSLRSISLATGVSRSTLRSWRTRQEPLRRTCPRCDGTPTLPEPQADYAYLLGLYLGDGCISRTGPPEKGVWALRVICADAWPGLIEECMRAITAIRPGNKIATVPRQGCTEVKSTSKHWPCLFPQHGPGKKHDRVIELAPWQRTIVEAHPGDFARGLFHSDGWRGVNRVRRPLADGERWYEYARYLFINKSEGILRLCGEALDLLGVQWCFSKPTTISVARRDAVARLDTVVGPKY
jgi:hypothetical protein